MVWTRDRQNRRKFSLWWDFNYHNLITALEFRGEKCYLALIHSGLGAMHVVFNFGIAMRSSLLGNFKGVESRKTYF